MKIILALALAISGLAFAQEQQVTKAEASAVFLKADRVMRQVLQLKGSTKAYPSATGVATRDSIVLQLSALLEAARPKMKLTPPTQPVNPSIISIANPAVRTAAIKLAKEGYVDRFGPLLRNKTPGLSPEELGDALGYFFARLAEATHTPSTKFSPAMMPPGE